MSVVSSLTSVSNDLPSSDYSPQPICLRVASRLQALATVLSWFDQLSPQFADRKAWEQCRIAVAEGFTNAVKHAHAHLPPETLVELQAYCVGESLEIQIWDQGHPFNLNHYLTLLSPRSPQDAESGRGLRLIRDIADRVHYERMPDGRNCLHLAKQMGRPETAESLISPSS